MTPLFLAWRSLCRQPARMALAVAGITAVGALLFNMLLLSRGLVLSFAEVLEATGFDVRVTAAGSLPGMGPAIERAPEVMADLERLAAVEETVALSFGRAEVLLEEGASQELGLMGATLGGRRAWEVVSGRSLTGAEAAARPEVLINANLAEQLELAPGGRLRLAGLSPGLASLTPVELEVAGIARFPFDPGGERTAVTTLPTFRRVMGTSAAEGRADLLLVASRPGAGGDAAAAAIEAHRGDLSAYSNRDVLSRFRRTEFSYFRQVSFVLTVITLGFALLLIGTLLTVSVNQRLAEIAALRALGLPRHRIVANLVCESGLIVGTGALTALPAGSLTARWLDGILRSMPGLPADFHFFVFEPRALGVYAALMAVTGLLATAYPVFLATRLPIAATLREEVVS